VASLFERLEAARADGTSPPGIARSAGLRESVLANIRTVLNGRQGCCQTRLDYGLPDLNGIAGETSEAVPAIARAVKAQIESFEPRLSAVVVRPATLPGMPGELAFTVSALLHDGEAGRALRFETVLGDDRQMRLRL